MKHKHAELIHAWADGAQIQIKDKQTGWEDLCCTPSWRNDFEYRIKPEIKPDIVKHFSIGQRDAVKIERWQLPLYVANIRVVFDGETGKLKSAEVL